MELDAETRKALACAIEAMGGVAELEASAADLGNVGRRLATAETPEERRLVLASIIQAVVRTADGWETRLKGREWFAQETGMASRGRLPRTTVLGFRWPFRGQWGLRIA